MKKTATLLLALVSILVFVLTGCSNDDTFTEKVYSSDENVIEKITVQVENRELEISASEDNQIYIDYFDGEKEYLDITVSNGKELNVKLTTNKTWTDFIGMKASKDYRKIKIKLPDNLLAAFSASTTNENIKIDSLSFTDSVALQTSDANIVCENVTVSNAISLIAKNGDITASLTSESADLKTSDGSIICNRINICNAISLTAKNGDIKGSIIGSWDDFSISCIIKKGDCNLPMLKDDGDKSFFANCNNGDINIEFIK